MTKFANSLFCIYRIENNLPFFAGEKRGKFIKEYIIDNQNNIKHKKQIRRKLAIFHSDAEDSENEY